MCLSCAMRLLEDHETTEGSPCTRCKRFLVDDTFEGDSDECYHCFAEQAELGEPCPVCQLAEIPKVFFDADMRDELERLKRLRTMV